MEEPRLRAEFRRLFRKLNRRKQEEFLQHIYETRRQKESDKHKNQFFIKSAKNGDLETVKRLLSEGADVNTTDKKLGNSALFYAVIKEDLNMVMYLLEKRADPKQKNKKGTNPITAAIYLGNKEIISCLKNN